MRNLTLMMLVAALAVGWAVSTGCDKGDTGGTKKGGSSTTQEPPQIGKPPPTGKPAPSGK